jgi:hypothetical protein
MIGRVYMRTMAGRKAKRKKSMGQKAHSFNTLLLSLCLSLS